MSDDVLSALEGPSSAIVVGRGSVAVVRGWIAAPVRRPLRSYRLTIDGETEVRRPTREVREVEEATARGLLVEGFRFHVPIARDRAGSDLDVLVEADVHGAGTRRIGHRIVPLRPRPEIPPEIAAHLRTPVVVCLCTYQPDLTLFRRQVQSLRDQTFRDWTCLVQDDASSDDRYAAIREICGADRRFVVARNARNLGFYRNFERCLSRVPDTAGFVALCDQDDVWYPSKLASCLEAFTDDAVKLVYSDMRLVDRDGRVLGESFWTPQRRNNHTSFETLLVSNTVTGAASVVRRSLLDDALPFPEPTRTTYHDHWLACVAMTAGRIAYVDRPLYDYVQHGANVVGHGELNAPGFYAAMAGHARAVGAMLLDPEAARNAYGGALDVHRNEHRKLALFRDTLLLRFPDMRADRREALELFSGRLSKAVDLAIRQHVAVLQRGDTTNMLELKLGASLLVHRLVEPSVATARRVRAGLGVVGSLVTRSRRRRGG